MQGVNDNFRMVLLLVEATKRAWYKSLPTKLHQIHVVSIGKKLLQLLRRLVSADSSVTVSIES